MAPKAKVRPKGKAKSVTKGKARVKPKGKAKGPVRGKAKAKATASKNRRSGRSGWDKYNEIRKRTGQRLDPYVPRRLQGTNAAVAAPRGIAVAAPAVVAPAVAAASGLAIVSPLPLPGTHVAVEITPLGDETPAVAACEALVRASPRPSATPLNSVETRSIGVGEHLSGEPFLWRGIFDMD